MSREESTDRVPRFVKKLLVVALVFVTLVRSGMSSDGGVRPVQDFDAETIPTTLTYNICCGWQTGHSTGCRRYRGIEHQPDAVAYVFGRNHVR